MEVVVKNIIGIFTIIDGKINVLTKQNDLINIECNDEIDIANKNYIKENLNIEDLNLKQCYTFSEKKENQLIISVLFVDMVNINNINLSNKYSFKDINQLDKDNKFIIKAMDYLKEKLVLNSSIKRLYPGEFVLPEIQKFYEELLNKKYDRRNFRKKLIKLDVIESLDKTCESRTGRPAKLYKFKEIVEDKILF